MRVECTDASEISISANRSVMAASSEFSQGMFGSQFRENDQAEIPLKEVPGEVLQELVQYCYSGRLTLTEISIKMMLETAIFWRITSIVDECCLHLKTTVTPSKCLFTNFLARFYQLEELFIASDAVIVNGFHLVCRSEEFKKIGLGLVVDLLNRDDLPVIHEEAILSAVVRWLKYDRETRLQFLDQLLDVVRCGQLQLNVEYLGFEPRKWNALMLS